LGSLRTLVLLVSLVVPGSAALAAWCDDPQAAEQSGSASTATAGTDKASNNAGASRQEPPAPPRKYLDAGASLFNQGRFDLASKYLQAAQMYRDRLSASERLVLDVYREKLDHYLKTRVPAATTASPGPATPGDARIAAVQQGQRPAGSEGAPADPGVVTASTVDRAGVKAAVDPVQALSRRPDESDTPTFEKITTTTPPDSQNAGTLPPPGNATVKPLGATATWRDTTDTKQKGRWLLQLAREQILKGHFDLAEQAIAEARGLDVKWTLFDETPDRMADALAKARVRAGSTAATTAKVAGSGQPHDRRTAKARLKEARLALAANDLDRAEEIAREVRSWAVSYGLFDDTPDKLDSAVFEARRREAVRNAELSVRTYPRRDQSAEPEPTAPAVPGPMPGSDTPTLPN
jgi:hypothetical protein